MANDIRTPPVPPGQVGQQPKTLVEKEQERLQEREVRGRVSAQDAQRVAQQAGFQRTRAKRKGLDIGDSSHAPIPIPDDGDTQVDVTPEALEGAQQNLSLASAQLGEAEQGAAAGAPLAETMVGSSFLPTEEGVGKMQELADRPAPAPLPLEEVTTSVRNLFNIDLGKDVPVGHKMLVTGLVVAGESGSVEVGKGGVNEQKLAKGLQKVAERSNQAVGEAQKMSKGVSRELNLQRTFVVKR
jgi:hypothetical protein